MPKCWSHLLIFHNDRLLVNSNTPEICLTKKGSNFIPTLKDSRNNKHDSTSTIYECQEIDNHDYMHLPHDDLCIARFDISDMHLRTELT